MTSRKWLILVSVILSLLVVVAACGPAEAPVSLDDELSALIDAQNVTALDASVDLDPELIALGQSLFFDKELSGNRDIACATCHFPTHGSGDGLAVSIGTGGEGIGPQREIGYGREFIPRNAPEVFNRGAEEWTSMFWDSRVFERNGRIHTPAGSQLPDGFENVLAAQAMFPVTSGDEMRGAPGDVDVFGQENELAGIDGSDFTAIWDGLMVRLLAHPEYVALFEQAYPDVATDDLGFEHAATAIAAFEIHAFTLPNSPWNAYLNGDTNALTDQQKEGAILFYGVANCSSCHTGALLTDQQHHTLAVPQVGPGKGDEAPLDLGRWRENGDESDMYAFRTPSLHNVATSFPYMHDGAFLTLESAVRHHLDPEASLASYDPADHVIPELVEHYQNDPELIADMLKYVDPKLAPDRELTDAEVDALVEFLKALTDPDVGDLEHLIPDSVPSGIPVVDDVTNASN